jgi:1-aminocyclopropane-1-carboxylate deaminase
MLFTEKLRPAIEELQIALLEQKNIEADVLRLDLIDPVISGNKWFKLKEYVQQAINQNKKAILTFGGAYSNHILATAAFCKQNGLRSVGIVRGEEAKNLSPTLQSAKDWGMELFFVQREKYKQKILPQQVIDQYSQAYFINEGGYGILGMKGAEGILQLLNSKKYTHIMTAVGTGTTLAGLINGSEKTQEIIGVSSLKNNLDLQNQINDLLPTENKNRFRLLHDYHFGGYAKYDKELVDFMNDWFDTTGIPSDFVYTGKLFYSFSRMAEKDFFPAGAKILLVHSGGLQGNISLKKGTLIF